MSEEYYKDNEMYKYLKEHSYISYNKKSNHQFELSVDRAKCIANKYHNLTEELEQENKQLKEELKYKPDTKWTLTTKDGKELTFIQSERIDMQEELNNTITKLFNQLKNKDSILTELEEYIKNHYIVGHTIQNSSLDDILNKLKELKEKHK